MSHDQVRLPETRQRREAEVGKTLTRWHYRKQQRYAADATRWRLGLDGRAWIVHDPRDRRWRRLFIWDLPLGSHRSL